MEKRMEKLLKRELDISSGAKALLLLVMGFFFVLTVIFSRWIYDRTRTIVQDQAIRSITNISQLNESSITRSIQNRVLLMKTLAEKLESENITDIDAILQELSHFQTSYDFANMGVIDQNGILHTLGGKETPMAGTALLDLLWSDQPQVSASYPPYDGSQYMVNAFSCPVFYQGEMRYVLAGTYYSRNLTERMNLSSMEGKGYTFLLNSQGEVVIYPQYYSDEAYLALMKYINDSPEIIPDQSGDQFFTYNGEEYYAHFEELGRNDWFLMTCAREADVFADANLILRIIFLGSGVLWGIILSSVMILYVSSRQNLNKRMRDSYYDELLGIGNENALEVCYRNLSPQETDKMYLVVFDIDKFKDFNYIYGSESGDKLLLYIVQVVQESFPQAYLFRYISDHFVALHPYMDEACFAQQMQAMDDRVDRDVHEGIIQPFEISAGVRQLVPGEPLRLAFSDAMIARETIKGNFLQHFVFYDGAIRDRRLKHMEMKSNFPMALENREFRVFYQPKYDIPTGQIIGAEALVRWVKEDGTIISPGEFIPCFEQSSQIVPLDTYILSEVCRQMVEMKAEGLDIRPVSVNLSRVHLRQPDLRQTIESIIRESGVDPAMLSFEITESALMEEHLPLKEIIDHLHGLGCRVELDDYGVGASNPDSLISNNFDILKLDKFFVDHIGNKRAEDIIRTTAHLAIQWNITLLAEGVEEREQAARLLELGCTHAQGFYYSRPVPEEAYRQLLRDAGPTSPSPIQAAAPRCFSDDICRLLDGNLLPTYIVDPERFVVMYCNKAMRGYLGEDPTGGLCYKKMRREDAPCQSCSAMRLYRDHDDSPKDFLTPLGVWVRLQAAPLHWQGRDYIQISCMDITREKKLEAQLAQAQGQAED